MARIEKYIARKDKPNEIIMSWIFGNSPDSTYKFRVVSVRALPGKEHCLELNPHPGIEGLGWTDEKGQKYPTSIGVSDGMPVSRFYEFPKTNVQLALRPNIVGEIEEVVFEVVATPISEQIPRSGLSPRIKKRVVKKGGEKKIYMHTLFGNSVSTLYKFRLLSASSPPGKTSRIDLTGSSAIRSLGGVTEDGKHCSMPTLLVYGNTFDDQFYYFEGVDSNIFLNSDLGEVEEVEFEFVAETIEKPVSLCTIS